MIDTSTEHALFYSIVDQIVSEIIRIAHISPVPKTRYLHITIEGVIKVLMGYFQDIIALLIHCSPIESVCAFWSCKPLKATNFHEVRFFNVQVLFLKDIHILEKVCQLTFNRIDLGSDLIEFSHISV